MRRCVDVERASGQKNGRIPCTGGFSDCSQKVHHGEEKVAEVPGGFIVFGCERKKRKRKRKRKEKVRKKKREKKMRLFKTN